MSNEEVIDGFLNNDTTIVGQCYAQLHTMLKKIVLQNSGTDEDVKDLLNETFIVFFEYCKKENFILKSKYSTFIYSIAYRKWMKKLKNRGKLDQFAQLSDNISLTDDNINDSKEINSIVYEVFQSLSENCQEILKLKYIENWSHKEIAEELNISPQYSRLRVNRCKASLGKMIQKNTDYKDLLSTFPFLRKISDPIK